WSYQAYIQSSVGEFSVAKHGYVASRCGWFSERSACYLASGRPVVVQDTGIDRLFPVGNGLQTFDSPQTAAACIGRFLADLPRQSSAARETAAEYFDSRIVLEDLLSRVFETSQCPT